MPKSKSIVAGWLQLETRRDRCAVEQAQYDLAIVGASWDPRCLDVLTAQTSRLLVVTYSNQGKSSAALDHSALLLDSAHAQEVRVASIDVAESLASLTRLIIDARADTARPLKILLELASLPRSVSMSILSLSLHWGWAGSVDFLYREANYPEPSSPGFYFYSGPSRLRDLPGYPGEHNYGALDHYVVSIGFAGMATHDALTAIDPTTVSVLLADPGTEVGYTEHALSANATLLSEFGEDPAHPHVRAPSGDVASAWEALRDFRTSFSTPTNWAYAMCGSKPHSLAMAIDALTSREPRLLYLLPQRHEECEIVPTEFAWHYRIENLANLGRVPH